MSENSGFRIPAHVRSVIDADGAVILDVVKGRYFSLNGVAVEVWTRLEAGMTLSDIELALVKEFPTSADVLAQDIRRFIERLRQNSLIEIVD
jgi:hypothetical protein